MDSAFAEISWRFAYMFFHHLASQNNSFIHRARSPHPPHVEEFVDDVSSWIKYMETDVQRYGGRLVVHVHSLSDAKVGSNPEASYVYYCAYVCMPLIT